MKFAIITHVSHVQSADQYFGYAPFIREMNIWIKYVDEVIIVAPLTIRETTAIDIEYKHNQINFIQVPVFSFTSFATILNSVFKLPLIISRIFVAMKNADHIHLRCPGNMGLIGCFVQILFPNKVKTAKYAGNWDAKSKQPWTYKLQRYILTNTFLTKKMQVLVYGDWDDQSKNIKPFFTATYSQFEKEIVQKQYFVQKVEFIFVGTLVVGKNPFYAIRLVEQLVKKGKNAILNIYGDGMQREVLEQYIEKNQLQNFIFLKGNHDKLTIKKAYQKSHFVLLPSQSEGWPKAIAEGMFWGCVPIATNVSCVPYMLNFGDRGILLKMNLDYDLTQIEEILNNEQTFFSKSRLAIEWSQKYTTDFFDAEIKKILL
ncbi:UDP-N-acetylglucosamine--peptide N-acetylglucosaminyltransferase GtfA subunit [Flavobacterium bizetiae]|uniref:UDP-N-acetylglucosamine--peptide N-acetylglucosaminyltransferase GtfA subunit n=1 Tax=Flavobacterium bizetiae TaxID=2704140 RepID=A0A6J4GZD9_9FLAO|nr:glycosyltransferase [Flavobacterium bizetiae]CAA9203668.1 UDP-N-acetylglucosamine--peptide N-acetylglucosaminyltransferase GtfA subunit [Flavobacterium bizetiae]CAD5344538.1 UDP-N-acetylglucosamine--peptide N-acetylglucosaminyltransferase GtfA subunit [Flavobacterium bizetiae]CAD5350607.1 UDP-N-acetylglucosamine--peptide N-acetylglucosaminyltransferase GtfA subunit [Flavobacterium bizetiae]